ncbi:MAG: helix-turn-helix transcriptional regulator [Saonia sp.]
MHRILFFIFLLFVSNGFGQYRFSGELEKNAKNKTVYLSLIDEHRKLSKIYVGQIIRSTRTDSLGFFKFEGDNLAANNQIYRIHTDGCTDSEAVTDHFSGNCNNSNSILFIAHNTDTIYFPNNTANEVFCDITSTNDKSTVFLQIDELKERMLFDFSDFRSETNRNINSKKWFNTLKEFGESLDEPLAELYIYDFLSDKKNETFEYYLQDLISDDYYDNLMDKLKENYPNTKFTQRYEAEIASDKHLINFGNGKGGFGFKFLLIGLLALSVLLNIYLIIRHKKGVARKKKRAYAGLTVQEQKTLELILQNKTNKEIASLMFLSVSTVKTHINGLYKKLQVSSREELKRTFQDKIAFTPSS